jgi:hypothetical protein
MITLQDVKDFKRRFHDEVAATVIREPKLSYKEIGKLHGITDASVCAITKARNIRRPTGAGSLAFKLKRDKAEVV